MKDNENSKIIALSGNLLVDDPEKKNDGLWAYFALTYAIMLMTWGLMAVFQLSGASVTSSAGYASTGGLVLLLLGGLSPTISGIFMTWRTNGKNGLDNLWKRAARANFNLKWYLVIVLIPLLVLGLRIIIQLTLGTKIIESPVLKSPANLISFTLPILLVGPLSEEFGWRGFAFDRLLSRWSLLKTNLLLGIFWAFWHLPLFFIPGTIQQLNGNQLIEFPIFALLVMGLTVFFDWLYIKSGRSIFAAILVHFVFNWIFSLSSTFMHAGSLDRLINAAAFAILAIGIWLFWKSEQNPSR
jgi:membrane protease YdiL (CAAX protease family)